MVYGIAVIVFIVATVLFMRGSFKAAQLAYGGAYTDQAAEIRIVAFAVAAFVCFLFSAFYIYHAIDKLVVLYG